MSGTGKQQPAIADQPPATTLQIYVYGDPTHCNSTISYTSCPTVSIEGNANGSAFVVYAPNSQVAIGGNGNWNGAVAAQYVTMNGNGNYSYDGSAAGLTTGSNGLYYRTAWQQCPPAPTSQSDLGSGC
jgi:hypothetical protein